MMLKLSEKEKNLSKEEFVDIVERLREAHDLVNKVDELMQAMNAEC